ncbi:MAG: spore maturation protein A [Oscillospiraceae bacterium]|nr:spore maturation protein A [Oscillospiraceae bacterium]
MVMGRIWCGIGIICFFSAILTGRGGVLAAAVPAGAQAGAELAMALTGSLVLWTGVGKLLEAGGVTRLLSRMLSPLLRRIFPGTQDDPELAGAVSGNICANFLGLGNAATPLGIRAVKRMVRRPGVATDEMCRLIVLNTASIQLIPANVAAVRAGLGSAAPFDILPAVWISSVCSAGLGVAMAWLLGRVWKDD